MNMLVIRLVYQDRILTFQGLLRKYRAFSNHHRHLQKLEIDM